MPDQGTSRIETSCWAINTNQTNFILSNQQHVVTPAHNRASIVVNTLRWWKLFFFDLLDSTFLSTTTAPSYGFTSDHTWPFKRRKLTFRTVQSEWQRLQAFLLNFFAHCFPIVLQVSPFLQEMILRMLGIYSVQKEEEKQVYSKNLVSMMEGMVLISGIHQWVWCWD